MRTQNQNATMSSLQCQSVLSDAVLQAARAAIPANAEQWVTLPASGLLNQPLLPLLVGLLDATQQVAAAVADNAWDDSCPLNDGLAAELAQQCHAIADDLLNATQCPDAAGWEK
jgi:hypothetical protein